MDLSGGYNDAVVNQNPPIFTAGDNYRALNKKGTIHFIEGNSMREATGLKTTRFVGLTGSQPRSVFAVMRRRAAGWQMLVGMGDTSGKGTYFGICDQRNGVSLPGGWGYFDNMVPPPTQSWNILEVIYDGKSEEGYINAVLKGSSKFKLNTIDKELEIGLRTEPNGGSSEGDFAELLVYDRALNDDERRQVEDYLSRKWFNIALSSHDNPLAWCEPQMASLASFTYSRNNGRFLLRCSRKGVDSLWLYDPTVPGRISKIAEDASMFDESGAGANNYAYASHTLRHNGITLTDASEP